jgi:glyoxylase-like metal-dependent hydrolase (beta-lactamase superfamily II)
MTIHKIYPEGFASNCYLLTADGKTAVAIDPAQPRILREAEARGLQVKFVLLTHGHFDHIGGCAALQSAGAKIGCSETEKPLALGKDNLGEAHGAPVPAFSVDFTVRGGEELRLCGIDFRVIATPGHTAGSVCYLAEGALFTGDTLFAGSVGRTDLPTGSGGALVQSVKALYATAGDYSVYAGHGADTTLEYERKNNGYIRA